MGYRHACQLAQTVGVAWQDVPSLSSRAWPLVGSIVVVVVLGPKKLVSRRFGVF